MGSFRQGSGARRLAFSVFALYALLLQAFLAASMPARALDAAGTSGAITCSLGGYGSGTPAGDPAHHHGLCCILGCAAAGCAYLGTASEATAFVPERVASPIAYGIARRIPPRPALKHYFAARAPPAAI